MTAQMAQDSATVTLDIWAGTKQKQIPRVKKLLKIIEQGRSEIGDLLIQTVGQVQAGESQILCSGFPV